MSLFSPSFKKSPHHKVEHPKHMVSAHSACVFGLVLMLLALVTNYWIVVKVKDVKLHQGLWQICDDNNNPCTSVPPTNSDILYPSTALRTSRNCLVIACLSLLGALVCMHTCNQPKLQTVLMTVAVTLSLVSLGVYNSNMNKVPGGDVQIGWSQGLLVVGYLSVLYGLTIH